MMENNFPYPTLTPLGHEAPTVATLKLLHKQLNANAISVPSARGNGALGHYILVVSAAVYTARATPAAAPAPIVFDVPINPGPSATHAAGATGAQIAEGNRLHGIDAAEFKTYLTTEASLKQQLLVAVPEVFYEVLGDDEVGYSNVTTKEILDHLDNTYGILTEDDIDKNLKLMHSPWSIQDPIETLFTRLKNCMTFAATAEPIPESSAVRAGLQILEATNQFPIACQEWRDKTTPNKTMRNFITHFSKADVSRKRTLTTKDAGFHRAAQVNDTPTKATGIMHLEINTTNSDDLTTNSANSAGSNRTPNSGGSNRTPSTRTSPNAVHYCWSHGIGTNPAHTSQTCTNKQTGHVDDSTIFDMKGGCNIVHRRRNEQQVYVRPPRRNTTPPSTNN